MPRFDEIRLDTSEYRLLRELFNERCGISLGPDARPIVERRLRERLAALGLTSFGEYYQLLRYDERGRGELDEALDLVTINETYFFREAYQLRAYQQEILPSIKALPAPRDRLSVWSAGCSTGEEVYSIAVMTREAGLFPEQRVRVLGTDISRRCIAQARRGVYGPSSFRATSPEMKRRYFSDRRDGTHVVDELRPLCHFAHLNLLEATKASVVGRVDVIFCRNVLIYFDDMSRRKVIDLFYERLLPGGYLLLGHSESLLNVSTAFELVHLREDLVYRKPPSSSRFASERPPPAVWSALAAPRDMAPVDVSRDAAGRPIDDARSGAPRPIAPTPPPPRFDSSPRVGDTQPPPHGTKSSAHAPSPQEGTAPPPHEERK